MTTTNATRISLAAVGSVAVIGGLIGAKAALGDAAPAMEPIPAATTEGNGRAPAASPTPAVPPPTATAPTSTARPPTPAAPAPATTGGTYTGKPASTRYGPVQVEIDVSSGHIDDIRVIQHPTGDRRSVIINDKAIPILIAQAMAAQSADVDVVSGATYTSQGYRQSLQSAIDQAGL